ncbi:MAG: TolC family protein [Steroidobacteraceae bacterium]
MAARSTCRRPHETHPDPRLALALSAAATVATAADRVEDLAWSTSALRGRPALQQAEALHLATRETRTQAWLAMLPLDASASKNWTGVRSDRTTNPAIGTVALHEVNLFSWNNWVNLKQSSAIVAQGEANYVAAQYDLIARVAQQYFGVLSAQDTLTAQDSALQSVARQLEQAERRYGVGRAITDVQIARAARDSSAAAVIAARRASWRAPRSSCRPSPAKYAALAAARGHAAADAGAGQRGCRKVAAAMDQNASLNAARMAAEISRDNYLAAWGAHLPAINVSASRSGTSRTATMPPRLRRSAPRRTPPTSSGRSACRCRSSAPAPRSRRCARRTTTTAPPSRRSTWSRARPSSRRATPFQGVISQIAQVQALKQAVESNRVSLAEAGYEVGTKTARGRADGAAAAGGGLEPATRRPSTATSTTSSRCARPPATSIARPSTRSTAG